MTIFPTKRNGGAKCLPTATQLARIRRAISALAESESELRSCLDADRRLGAAKSELKDRCTHALEIASGWDEVDSLVLSLPEDSLDRGLYQTDVDAGLCRSRLLVERAWALLAQARRDE